ncbi:MAG: hypothetical protein HY744_01075 [Deltaproteobacteria bacterium]|nr:hypothetical protein [Deltaproteobacteria bacterium]
MRDPKELQIVRDLTVARRVPAAGFFAACAIAATAALLLAVWIVDFIPTNDGPQNLYTSYVSLHFDEGPTRYATFYRPGSPVTAVAFSFVYSLFDAFLPWQRAMQATVSVGVLAWAWSFMLLVLAIEPRRWAVGLLGFPSALSWGFYMGFFNYAAAVAVGFFALAFAIAYAPQRPLHRVGLGALVLLGATFHVMVAGLTGLGLVLLVLFRVKGWRQKLRELGLLALAGLPALVVIAVALGATQSLQHYPGYAEASVVLLPLAERLAHFGRCFVGGPWWRAWPPVLCALAAWAVCARGRFTKMSAAERSLLALGALAAAAGLLVPLHTSVWQFFSPRFLPIAVLAAAAVLPVERLAAGRLRHVAAAVGIAYALCAIGWSVLYHLDLARRSRDPLAGLTEPIRRSGPRLPIVLDPLVGLPRDPARAPMAYTEPLRNLGQLYAVQQGGVVPYTFTGSPQVHALTSQPRPFPPVPSRRYWKAFAQPERSSDAERRAIVALLASYGARYDDVVFWGSPADADRLVARGYVADFRRGGLLVARFQGCPAKLVVRGAAPARGPLVAEYGWYPVLEPFWSGPVDVRPDQPTQIELPHAPCGDVWVRVAPSSGAGSCLDADSDGLLHARVGRATGIIVCELGQSP